MQINDEKLEDIIDKVIQNELRYETDLITHDGWKFFENEAPELLKQKVKEMLDEDDDIDENDLEYEIDDLLQDIISKYDETHPSIRTREEF